MPVTGDGGYPVIDPDDVGSSISLTDQMKTSQIARDIGQWVGSDIERNTKLSGLGPADAGVWCRRTDMGGARQMWDGTAWRTSDTNWRNYAPTVLSGGLVVGTSGMLRGRYKFEGGFAVIQFSMVMGFGSNAGSGTYYFSLPFTIDSTWSGMPFDPYWWAASATFTGAIKGSPVNGFMRTSNSTSFAFRAVTSSGLVDVGSNGIGNGWSNLDRINGGPLRVPVN